MMSGTDGFSAGDGDLLALGQMEPDLALRIRDTLDQVLPRGQAELHVSGRVPEMFPYLLWATRKLGRVLFRSGPLSSDGARHILSAAPGGAVGVEGRTSPATGIIPIIGIRFGALPAGETVPQIEVTS